jgi:hypothetical protein
MIFTLDRLLIVCQLLSTLVKYKETTAGIRLSLWGNSIIKSILGLFGTRCERIK